MVTKRVAIIGTNGIPSKYGGFETLVEYLAEYLSDKYEITVFCSSKSNQSLIPEYNGCNLKYIPLKANGWQSIPYDIISILQSYKTFDKLLVLGSSGGIIIPFLSKYRSKFVFNFGGLDWERSKWGFFTQKFLKFSESMAVRYSAHLISDNLGIQEYIKREYQKDSALIAYGGDQVFKVSPNSSDFDKYPFLHSDYAFSVARIQPDNNIDMLLDSFMESPPLPFVLVGNWNNSAYGLRTKAKYSSCSNVTLLDAIYDQRELNLLRSNCRVYLHGHSAGGTNPALVEAMNLSLPIFAYDCVYNKHTTGFKAEYFSSSIDLVGKLKATSEQDLNINGESMKNIAQELYQWKIIAEKYSAVIDG